MKSKKNLLLVGGGADAVNVRYACGFTAPDPFLFVQKGEEKHLLVSVLELGRARALGQEVICHSMDSLGLKRRGRRSLGKQAAALLTKLNLKRISVSPECPVGMVRELERSGFRVGICTPPVYPERLLKTAEEVRKLKASQRAAVSAMRKAFECIRAGRESRNGRPLLNKDGSVLTAEEVRRAIELELLNHDCSGEEMIVACGDQAVDPHERGSGPLVAGQWIVLDIFPRSKTSGYWGDITRTVMKGRPSPEQKKLYQTVRDAQTAALKQIKPGITGKSIHEGICEKFRNAGFETGDRNGIPQGFIHSTGHGVGLEIHEGPSVSPAGGELQPGQVITIEPGLYYRGMGGVRIEDTVVVTENGYSLLAPCTKEPLL